MSTQSQFKISIRLIDSNSSLLAKADLQGQKFNLNGFSIMQGKDNRPNWISEPSTKAGSGWVKSIEVTDKALREQISKAILEAYEKAIADRGEAPIGNDQEQAF